MSSLRLRHFESWSPVGDCLGRIRTCDLGGESASMRVGLRFHNPPAIPVDMHIRVPSLLPLCGKRCALSAVAATRAQPCHCKLCLEL